MSYVERIIGKYVVVDNCNRYYSKIYTDNPLEAVYEANKKSTREIINICGEREFYHDGDRWRLKSRE